LFQSRKYWPDAAAVSKQRLLSKVKADRSIQPLKTLSEVESDMAATAIIDSSTNSPKLKKYWPNAAKVSRAKLQLDSQKPQSQQHSQSPDTVDKPLPSSSMTSTENLAAAVPANRIPPPLSSSSASSSAKDLADKMGTPPPPPPAITSATTSTSTTSSSKESVAEVPLEGVWQMVYTTALDVLSLAANPLTIVQGIYQVSTTPDT
jgi:hypothetical protein